MKHGLPIAAALLTACLGSCRSANPAELEKLLEQGQAELDRGNLNSAATLAERGHRAAVDAGDRDAAWSLRVLRGEVLAARRQQEEALNLLAEPPPPGAAPYVRARGLMTRANVLCELEAHGDPRGDRVLVDKLLADTDRIAREISSTRLGAEVAVRRGVCDINRGQNDRAEAEFRRGWTTARDAGLRNVQSHAAVGLGLLRMYAARYDDAADWFERGLQLAAGEAIDVKNIGNLGWCYRMLGDTDKAVPLLLKTVETATRQGLAENAAIALFHLGEVHILLQDVRAARGYFARAQALFHQLGQKDFELEALGLLETLAFEDGDAAAARAYATQTSSLLAVPGRAPPVASPVEASLHAERGELDTARRIYERIAGQRAEDLVLATADRRWQALAGIASLEVAQGNTAAAERAFARAQQAIEEMRSKLQQDTYDFLLFSSLNDFYGRYAAFLVDKSRASEALALIDRNRGRVLWERLAPGSAAVSPERFEPAARESRAVLLSYWLGERSFLWVVTDGSTEVHELPPAAEIRSRVERYQEIVQRSRDPLEMPASATGDLYNLLVAPAQPRIPKGARVVIVPDGALHALSFDTLVVPSPAPHYWIEDVVTMRAPSLGLLTAPRAPSSPPDRALLAIGDPVQPSHEFPELPNAAREMVEVARHFPAAGVVSVSGAAATPRAYREADPSRFAYIHFAAHATSHTEQPLESAVVLSQRDLGFKLYAHEIVTMPIRAEVVTLSACRGAGARAYRGEGLVGFTWAFLRAGARQVVAGLWNVEDASTARVMSGLYGHLARGMPPPEALREARLALLHDPGAYRKPFYWGPFVVYVQQQGGALARSAK
jgi:CHAT domain-containing protein